MERIWKMSLLIVAIILVDQFSKGAIQSSYSLGEVTPVIPGFFNITYTKNPGIAFGIGSSLSVWLRMFLFKVIPVFACFWFLKLIWDSRHTSLPQCLSFSMIFAGAVGNLIDRISMDYVVDMFDFYYGNWHFATFNVADASISIAAAIYAIDALIEEINKRKNKATEKVQTVSGSTSSDS